MEGERKGAEHDMGKAGLNKVKLPLRRWEEWERSRLRKIKRDEKRRRDMEQAFPSGYPSQNGVLAPHDFDQYSRSASSDTLSVASSEEDVWGGQIGGYNENSATFPPVPAVGLVANSELMASSTTLGDDDMEALLDAGFEETPSQRSSTKSWKPNRPPALPSTPRYQLSDSSRDFHAYSDNSGPMSHPPPPRERLISPTSPFVPVGAASSAVQWQSHAKKRSVGKGSGGDYGPLGPLDPGDRM